MTAPQLSIVIPTCDRPEGLLDLLDRLRATRGDAPALRCEVIVSDDGDGNAAGERVRQRFPDVRFVAGPRRGPAANRNHGARHAVGEWLVFVDDDCQPAEGWLAALAQEIAGGSLDVIEGKIVAPDKCDSIFRRHVENLTGDCFWSANLAIRRDVFDRIGGFDEDFAEAGGEDLELAHRIRTSGIRAAFCASAVVYHPSHVVTWRGIFEHALRIRWHVLYHLKVGQSLPIVAPDWLVIPYATCMRTVDLLRTSLRSLRVRATDSIPALVRMALAWTMFPLMLPYILYWEIKFRRMLRARAAVRRTAIAA